ncbi:MAG: hypothetical protein MUE81_00690 [Thermoflexibacter sp.]|jgi:hypothetical protein|nr:hypothetical protein [Thermoflexibacter sp.]
MKYYLSFFICLICLVSNVFAQEKKDKPRISQKELLGEVKDFLGEYDRLCQRLLDRKTDSDDLKVISDSIINYFFFSPATKVYNDLVPNGDDLIAIPIEEYVANLAFAGRKGLSLSQETCFARISVLKKSEISNFHYVEVIFRRQLSGKNFNEQEILFNNDLIFFISFETYEKKEEDALVTKAKNLQIRKITRSPYDIDNYYKENPDLKLGFQKRKVYFWNQPSIRWKSKFKEGNVLIELIDNEGKKTELTDEVAMSTQYYKWRVRDTTVVTVGATYRLKVSSLTNPKCLTVESKPFVIRPKIKKWKWITLGGTTLVGSLIMLFKNQLFPVDEPLLAEPASIPRGGG